MTLGVVPQFVGAPRGSRRTCKTWAAEGAYRLIQNNVDPEVAENAAELVVYGGTGKAARNHACYEAILRSLRDLESDETLLVQSGKPVGIVRTHDEAPRVLIANTNLVPRWATWEVFHELDRKGLMMYGQMTAGSWIYIGTQGILQGTYETFNACGRVHFLGTPLPLSGRVVVSSGLGGMGGAQPLAATLAGAAFLGFEVDPERIRRRLDSGYIDEVAPSLEEGWKRVRAWARQGEARSVAVEGNAAELLQDMVRFNYVPDVLTDQTSAHDPLNGYVPAGLSLDGAVALRASAPQEYVKRAKDTIGRHVSAMLELQAHGAVTFDYGNNIRALAEQAGIAHTRRIPGFVPEYIRPLFCEGGGPFRWVALGGAPGDIAATDAAMLAQFPDNAPMQNWLRRGAPRVKFQGLPARICWLRYGEREEAGALFNWMVKKGKVSAPLAIGRDHLDCGSVASPNRETEAMLDGSDAVADWAFLNAMLNAANGASWVSVHQGGGVGIGYSQHAGMVVVADGTPEAERRVRRVLRGDPAVGVFRHVDAGYPEARNCADSKGLKVPMARYE